MTEKVKSWLKLSALLSLAVGALMCPPATAISAVFLLLLSNGMTPRALDKRMEVTIGCAVVLSGVLMLTFSSATVLWALLVNVPLVAFFGRPRPDDLERRERREPDSDEPAPRRHRRRRRNRSVGTFAGQSPALNPAVTVELQGYGSDGRPVYRVSRNF